MNTKRLTKLVAVVLVLVMALTTLTACPNRTVVTPAEFKQAEYNTTTSVMPSNWNELTYKDNNDTQILSYIGSNFFEYDYLFEDGKKYNEDGSINKDAIVSGAFSTNYSAATAIEDVTSLVDAKWGYTDEQKAAGGYAWKITLRDDLKWQNGDPITAADFVYSMQQTLDPSFMNHRADTYYETLRIKNSREYFYSKAPSYTPIVPYYEDTPDYSFDMSANDVYMNVTSSKMTLTGYSLKELVTDYVRTEEALAALAVIEDAANEFGYTLITAENEEAAKELLAYALLPFGISWDKLGDATKEAFYMESLFYVSGYGEPMDWENVGIYAVEGENALVLCLDVAYEFVREGELTYYAAYYLSSLPLVHEATYEANKVAPKEGATLWTSTYNSDLKSTMSWGPYYLVEFEAGSHFRLEKNPNWYGWNLEQYKNQYNVTAINTRKVEEFNTQWMGFLAGNYDDSSLDTTNVDDYSNSKYVSYTPGSYQYAMQLYSNLPTLKASANNNGILAIYEFRLAFNLALNRSDVIQKIWPGTAAPLFGLLSTIYYYDIEGGSIHEDGGNYRENDYAKAGVLRAYGYTEAADGTWSINDLVGLSLDDAYETLTGYNPTLAKEKFAEAVAILEADPEYYGYDSSKDITIVYGSSVDTDKQRFRCDYLQGILNELAEGTSLEGKIKLVFDASAGDEWAEAFRTGKTQIGFGYGMGGNAFNPFDVMGAFVDPNDSINYHMYWDTSAIDLTLTLPEGDYAGAGEEHTMSVLNWYYCLNGLAEVEGMDVTYDWGAGSNTPYETRVMILAALEEVALKESRTVMLITDAGGSFLGAKFSHFNEEYNIFMGFGGLRYMVVNYTDAEWDAYVEANNGDLSTEYKKSE